MIFKKLRFKNILSFGNTMTEIDLSNNQTNLFFGKNGAGKTTILEALHFNMTGKPYRNINKGKLSNTTNKKGLYTEVEFEKNGITYLVKRGITPNVFEIFQNGTLIDQDSHVKDYQEILEKIIGISTKTFAQVCVMSSMSYIPFLRLSAAEKRTFIEDILQIRVFSIMNKLLKVKRSIFESKIDSINKDISSVDAQIKIVEEMNENRKNDFEKLKINTQDELSKIEASKQELLTKQTKIVDYLNTTKEKLSQLTQKISKKPEFEKALNKISFEISSLNKKIDFYKKNPSCPTCERPISESHATPIIESFSNKIESWKSKEETIRNNYQKIQSICEQIDKVNQNISKANSAFSETTSGLNMLLFQEKSVLKTQKELEEQQNQTLKDTKEFLDKKKNLEIDQIQLKDDKEILEETLKMLSDDGIKRYILHRYVPLLNNYVNEYLTLLDANYRIQFNEELEEKLDARGYEDLTYANLSSGERQRADLALLFAFLDLCKTKNSAQINLLFLDEILDQSLDDIGIDGVFSIFSYLKKKGNTIFVISHKHEIREKFDKAFMVKKTRFSSVIPAKE